MLNLYLYSSGYSCLELIIFLCFSVILLFHSATPTPTHYSSQISISGDSFGKHCTVLIWLSYFRGRHYYGHNMFLENGNTESAPNGYVCPTLLTTSELHITTRKSHNKFIPNDILLINLENISKLPESQWKVVYTLIQMYSIFPTFAL